MFDQLITKASLDLTASLKESAQTARLLGALAQRPMNTFSLAREAGITSRQVWSYLSWHKERGHVLFDPKSGIWQSETAQQIEAVKRAAQLLESKGWKCTPPEH